VPLFEVDENTKRVVEIKPTTFPELGLWERQDLEAWVSTAPELAGGDFTVVTSEYDRFDRTNERLDVLGIVPLESGQGRLVVVELKRDGTSTTVDLQAIKYAAYVAAAQFSDVVDLYARHHSVTDEEAREALVELLGGTEDEPPLIDNKPRIVLVAGDFRAEVTTTVLWLIDNFEMDIRCVRLQPFSVDGRTLVHSEVIIPLPEAEQYRLGVQRKCAKSRRSRSRRRVRDDFCLVAGGRGDRDRPDAVLPPRRRSASGVAPLRVWTNLSTRPRSSPARAFGACNGQSPRPPSRDKSPRLCSLRACCTGSARGPASCRARA